MKRTILPLIALGFVSPAMAAQDPVHAGHYDSIDSDLVGKGHLLPTHRDDSHRALEEIARGSAPWDSGPDYVDSGDYYIGASRPN